MQKCFGHSILQGHAALLPLPIKVIHGFRVGITHDRYIGVFPPRMEKDDIVYVLKHSLGPVLLRKVVHHYEHVGTCFVLGFMNGEVARYLFRGRTRIEFFEICEAP